MTATAEERQVGAGRRVGDTRPAAAPHLGDPDVRLGQLEENVDALSRELETLREDLRALASAVREIGPDQG